MFLDANNHSLQKKKNVTYILQGEVMEKETDQVTNLPYMLSKQDFFWGGVPFRKRI